MKGANDALKAADVDAAAEMLKTADCIVLQFEIPLETVYYTVAFARKHGIRCIVNPAPGQPVDMRALADLDYFVPNESEAETITGIAVRNVEGAKKCAEKLVAGGIRRVIITLGAKGSLLAGQRRKRARASFCRKEYRQLWCGRCIHRKFRSVPRGRGAGTRGSAARQSVCWTFDDRHRNAKIFL